MKKKTGFFILLVICIALFTVGSFAIAAFDKQTANEQASAQQNYELKKQYSETRANYIFGIFNMDFEQYQCAYSYELFDYTGDRAYIFARETMDHPTGSSVPVFYVNESADTFFAVYQDPNAVNYMYEYALDENGSWYVKNVQKEQDVGRYPDIVQSFKEYKVTQNEESLLEF